MNFPVSQLSSIGSNLERLSQKMNLLAEDAYWINNAIYSCYGQGGVGGQVSSVAGEILGQADTVNRLGGAAVQAAELYLTACENILANTYGSSGESVSSDYFIMGVAATSVASLLGSSKVNLSSNSGVKSDLNKEGFASEVLGNAIDESRKGSIHKSVKSYEVYSSKNTGNVSILGDDFHYTKYTDYKKLYYSDETGDRYYSSGNAGLKIIGEHIEFTGGGAEGSIDTNSMCFGLDASHDPAKGDIYVKANAEWDALSLNLAEYDPPQDSIFSAGLSAKLGAGGKFNAGFHDGKFTADVSAAAVVGLEIQIDFNYSAAWDSVTDFFSPLVKPSL